MAISCYANHQIEPTFLLFASRKKINRFELNYYRGLKNFKETASSTTVEKLHISCAVTFFRQLVGPSSMIGSAHVVDLVETHNGDMK